MRVGVTGSRNWLDYRAIYIALQQQVVEPHWQRGYDSDGGFVDWLMPPDFTMVVGDCKTGADAYATDWMVGFDRVPEIHRADWKKYGPPAGPLRNAEMVATGADLWLAFIMPCSQRACRRPGNHGSHGATMTARLAEAAGIRTLRYYP